MRPVLIAAILLLAACAARPPTALDRLNPCEPVEGPADAFCGVYEVFEDREAGSGRTIPLKVVVLPAFDNDPAPDPLFFLAGGPGQAAAELAAAGQGLRRVRRTRDLVFINQRGTGKDNPLKCEDEDEEEDDTRVDLFDTARAFTKLRECLEAFETDPTLYTTSIAADDLNEIREWLSYEKINLFGVSYGTRAALEYLRRHESTVRTVTLDSVAPISNPLPLYFARDVERALEKMLADCAADAGCNERYPDLREKLEAVDGRLERERPIVEMRHPRSGEPFRVQLPPAIFRGAIAANLYITRMSSLIPLVVDEAAGGNFAPFLALASNGQSPGEGYGAAMFYSVICSEDAPRIEASEIEGETAGTFVGRSMFETRFAPCEFWPRGEVADEYYEPVRSDVPTLALSGDLDPVTPPSWGDDAVATLTNSRHLVARSVGHGVVFGAGCGVRLLDEFLEAADASQLDGDCLDETKRPPFFLHPNGSEVATEESDD